MRVQIPVYTDRWMMGDRYGEVVKVTRKCNKLTANEKARTSYRWELEQEIAHVLLDKSGKTVRVILFDCTPVD